MHDNERVVHKVNDSKGKHLGHMIFCPACDCGHMFDSRWTFNGNFDKPTFRAIMLVTVTVPITDDEHTRIMNGEKFEPKKLICHSFVTDGKIKFLGDCTHSMKNQEVQLPKF